MTSTIKRNYKFVVESAKELKKEKFSFDIIIAGRYTVFNSSNIPKILNDTFIFNHGISYFELYKIVESSDYIIIPLDPKNKYDTVYKNKKVTGSILLAYGFLKPTLINQEFASFYNLNKNNSLII